MRVQSVPIAVIILLLYASTARCNELANPQISAESKMLAQDIVQAVCRNSEQLRSGVFTAEGVETYTDRTVHPPRVYSAKVSIFCAFDFDARTIRFDRKPMHWQPEPDRDQPDLLVPGDGQLIVTPTMVICRSANSKVVLIGRHDVSIAQVELFRVDLSGIATRREMKVLRGGDWETRGLQQFFSANPAPSPGDRRIVAKRFLREDRLISVDDSSRPFVRLAWSVGAAQDATHSVVFNESAGWMPVRMLRRYTDPRAVHLPGVPAPRFVSREESQVQWQKRDQVYVPISLRQQEESSTWGASRESIRELPLAIDWESVNTPPDPIWFTLEGLQLPDGVRVWDRREGDGQLVK